ncbi:MAG: YceI family protein [Candidatus Zixiibacteriota bacterium]
MLKRSILTALVVLTLGLTAHADTWHFDKAHSSVGFAVRHMVVSKTTGKFDDFEGAVEFDGKNIEAGSVNIAIKMASIDTDNTDRDKHLKSGDFFDIEKYPEMTFKSKKITKGSGNTFTMVGTLTIKDVSRDVTLEGEFNGVIDDPWGNTRAGFTAKTKINRQDFNVAFDNKLQDGSLVVGNDVEITLEIELIKAK